jgi:hypothetical protein
MVPPIGPVFGQDRLLQQYRYPKTSIILLIPSLRLVFCGTQAE